MTTIMKKVTRKSINVYNQAAIALLLIQLVHKIVREIPGALKMGGAGQIMVPIFAGIITIGIVLIFFRIKWGLILGFLDGIFMIFQPILVHVILAHPDQNGIWWYPIFPWTQAILIIYFCRLAWKNWNS
jgi:hypothetical protein